MGDMAQKLPLARVTESAVVTQLVDLADIVENGPGQQQVQVNALVVGRGQAAHTAQARARARADRPRLGREKWNDFQPAGGLGKAPQHSCRPG